jgi:transcriptional regulator with XRE-family HTH domain
MSDTLADAVRQARLDRGWSKEEAARRAGISSITWKRVEDGLPVQDVKRRVIEALLFHELSAESKPDLATFSDRELLREVERRLLIPG